MKTFALCLLAGGAAALASLAPVSVAFADNDEAAPPAVAAEHGNYTLKQREEWLESRLDKARDDNSIDHHEYERVRHSLKAIHEDEERMRDHHDGQLTDNETATLEARLDDVAKTIHWLHENSFEKPW